MGDDSASRPPLEVQPSLSALAHQGAFLNAALDSVVMVGGDGRVVEFNPSAEQLFGYSRQEVIGQLLVDLIIPPELRPAHLEAFRRFIETREQTIIGRRIEVTAMRSDGGLFPVELALGEVGGEPLLICGVIRDLTAAKFAEAELKRLVEEQRALREIATLIATGTDLPAVLETVCRHAGQLAGAIRTAVVHMRTDRTPEVITHWAGATSVTDSVDPVDVRAIRSSILLDGNEWGGLLVETRTLQPQGTINSLNALAELVGIAVSSAAAREELHTSRARIIATADAARARLQRDIHDGAQQRLVSALIHLQLADERQTTDPASARASLRAAQDALNEGIDDLRDSVAGLHPKILAHEGLAGALHGLASRCAVPVTVDAPTARYQQELEAAVYFFVAETLTNVDKYAHASTADVSVVDRDGWLTVRVADDGVGGANVAAGSGLRGLQDRFIAYGGTFKLDSEPGTGTCVTGSLPEGGRVMMNPGPE